MDNRKTAHEAGYMELANARKTGDCRKVRVKGGISLELGCCNFFERDGMHVQSFRCGNCEYKILQKPTP